MLPSRTDVLAFVEDPGAANWLAPAVVELAAHGVLVSLLADGAARPYLARMGIGSTSLPVKTDVKEWLAMTRPGALLIGTAENPRTRAFDLILAARDLAIPSFAVVDQWVNAEHRFRGLTTAPLHYAPDMVFVADRQALAAYLSLGLPADRINAVGNPHHEAVRARHSLLSADTAVLRQSLFPDVSADVPLVVFLSELGYVVNPEARQWECEYGLTGRGGTSYRTMVVLEEVLDAISSMQPKPALVVRLHPKSLRSEFDVVQDEISSFSKEEDALAVCMAADLVVGMTTSLLEEAMLLGCRTLSVLPRKQEAAWLPSILEGTIPHVTTRTALRDALPRLLHLPKPTPPPAKQVGAARMIATRIKSALHGARVD